MNISNLRLFRNLLFFCIVFFSYAAPKAYADGYQVKFRIDGLKDTICLVANYYGNGTYIKDTLKVDNSGRFTFKAPDDLPKGIYLIVITDKNYFEFIVNQDKKFSMETQKINPADHMIISGSPENTLFYDYLKYNRLRFEDITKLQNQEKGMKDADSIKVIDKKIGAINDETIKYKLDLVKEHPDSFVALFINAMKEPDIPEIPTLANGKKDSAFVYRYYKDHFWDGTNFTDDRLLRTPVFHSKLMKYFDKVLVQLPDTIIHESDRLIEKARPNPEMFKYLVWFSTWHYENSEIMGMDKVFIHVVDQYYVTNQTPWVNATIKENLIKKANRIRPLLIGSKAPNIIMQDTSFQLVSMYDIKAKFLILLFWDPDCGHCEQEIPKIKKIYEDSKSLYDLKIMTICSDTSMAKMKTSIKKREMNWINVDGPRSLTGNYHDQYDVQTTPVLYILNERKEIIAKQLGPEQIPQFLKNYLAREK